MIRSSDSIFRVTTGRHTTEGNVLNLSILVDLIDRAERLALDEHWPIARLPREVRRRLIAEATLRLERGAPVDRPVPRG